MGYGDDLLLTGILRKNYEETGKKGSISYDSPIFEKNPYMGNDYKVEFKPFPYIKKKANAKLIFNDDFKAIPGDLFLTAEDMAIGERLPQPYIVIEPNIKKSVSADNKDWGWSKWEKLVDSLEGIAIVQASADGKPRLSKNHPQVKNARTASFREACGVLACAELFVGTDGGLHHAAAALGIKAVVIWGGYSSPKHLGYDEHINLHDGSAPCGSRRDCEHCRQKMSEISVEDVKNAINRCLFPSSVRKESV